MEGSKVYHLKSNAYPSVKEINKLLLDLSERGHSFFITRYSIFRTN